MTGKLVATKTTYEFELAGIKTLLAKSLEVDESRMEVEYVISEVATGLDNRYPGIKQVTKVRVVVNS